MRNKENIIIYFIVATILATISIQIYWNLKNYKVNKQQLINEVQIAFDNGLELYYTDLAKTNALTFVSSSINSDTTFINKRSRSFHLNNKSNLFSVHTDSFSFNGLHPTLNRAFILSDSLKRITSHGNIVVDTIQFETRFTLDSLLQLKNNAQSKITGISIVKDSLTRGNFNTIKDLTNKIIISLVNDTIEFEKLSSILDNEFKRKEITMDFALAHYHGKDSLFRSYNNPDDKKYKLFTYSKPTYLRRNEQLKIVFPNLSLLTLKKGLTGILLSLLLSTSIIACLIYLLNIINRQKQLAEIKNDLISNITHEFKTPIATVSTALEGIQNFNAKNDKEKTAKYLNISNQQLKKLHLMVEKLLETATLDSDKLILNKEPVDLVLLLKNITDKHQMMVSEKLITFRSNIETLELEVDAFHLENAISNLIDNAIKYGGNAIDINLNAVLNSCEITVADNGGKIEKSHRDKIFDKFYRIPKGNQHDVKGFGIGLYYTKKIIEKHMGSIQLLPDPTNTIFKVKL